MCNGGWIWPATEVNRYPVVYLRKGNPQKESAENRQVWRGHSFHTVVVACLLDLWLWKKQARTDPKGAKAIEEKWREEMSRRSFEEIGEKDDATAHVSMSERDKEEEALLQLVKIRSRGMAEVGCAQLWRRWRSQVAEREADTPVPAADEIAEVTYVWICRWSIVRMR